MQKQGDNNAIIRQNCFDQPWQIKARLGSPRGNIGRTTTEEDKAVAAEP